MTINFIALSIGAIVAAVVIISLKRLEKQKTTWVYPLILATLPVYYWAFAIYAVNYDALLIEVLIGTLFIAAALLSYRFLNTLGQLTLGIAFIIHALYDIAHVTLISHDIAPTWWPEFCGAIDLLIGIYLLWSIKYGLLIKE